MAINITSRIRNAMVSLSVGLCLLFTGLIFLLIFIIEDQVFENQLKVEQAAYERLIANADSHEIARWQPANANILLANSTEKLPDSLPDTAAKLVIERTGIHEYFDDHNAMFIAHLLRPDTGASYYLVYDVSKLLAVRGSKLALFTLIGMLTLLITALAVLFARQLTKSTLAPVARLSNALQNNDLDDVVIKLANEFSEDEIAILTRELVQALENVRESAQREYQFNRGVSHELRTPIQVAQSAAELLQIYAGEGHPKLKKPISRLKRSVTEMNEIADAFLWLASDRVLEQSEMCSVAKLHKTLAALQSAFHEHEILINADPQAAFNYPIPSTVLSVVVRSLIRNAVMHGEQSAITVDLKANSITVSNSVNLLAHDNKGFGMGLSIVQRICDRFDCALNASREDDNCYSVFLVFA
jgi:signal transduction histidine kinase